MAKKKKKKLKGRSGKWGRWGDIPSDVVDAIHAMKRSDVDWNLFESEEDGEQWVICKIYDGPSDYQIMACHVLYESPYFQPYDHIILGGTE